MLGTSVVKRKYDDFQGMDGKLNLRQLVICSGEESHVKYDVCLDGSGCRVQVTWFLHYDLYPCRPLKPHSVRYFPLPPFRLFYTLLGKNRLL